MNKFKLKSIIDDECIENLYDVTFNNDEITLNNSNEIIVIKKIEDKLHLERKGNIKHVMLFDLNEETDSFLETEEGILFEFIIKTTKLFISNDGFLINYDLYEGSNLISQHKLIGKTLK